MASSRPNIQRTRPIIQGARPNKQGARPNIQGASQNKQGACPNIKEASPNIQGARPNKQGVCPNIQGASQNIQGASPNKQRACPNKQGASQNIQGASPNKQGASPNIQGASPNIQGASPNKQGASPNIQGASLHIQVASPNIQRDSLNKQGASPNIQGARPNIQGARSNKHGARANIHGASPIKQEASPNIQGASPNKQGACPNKHGARPKKQGARPNKQGARPNKQGARPDKHGACPNIQGNKQDAIPNIQGASPHIQGASPNKQGTILNKQGASPNKHGARLNIQGARPNKQGTSLNIQAASPNKQGAACPNRQGARPNKLRARPNIHGASPDKQGASQNIQGARPIKQRASPNIKGASPNKQEASPNRQEAREASRNKQGASPNIQRARPSKQGASPNLQGASPNKQEASPNREGARSNIQSACEELTENLNGFYRKHHSTIPISPLVEENDVDLLEFYVEPPMAAIDLQPKFGTPKKSPVKIGKKLFYRDDKNVFKNIYVIADPGLGKTAFSQRICMAWCQAHDPVSSLADKFEPDEVLALQGFEFLFLIPLRDAHKSQCELDDIIRAYLHEYLPRGPYLDMLDTIFNESSCLILLDGMDEWSYPESCSTGHNAREIPHRKFRKNWTILTTTRPWKFDEIRLASYQIDRLVEINELDEKSFKQLVINSVNLLNQSLPEDNQKSVKDFNNTISLIKLGKIRNIPYIRLQCVCLWSEEKDIGRSKCEIYINVIELTLGRGIEKIKSGLHLPPAQAESEIHVPKFILETQYFKQHLPLLLKLGKMAFYALFDNENRQRLVLDVTFARKYLEQKEIEFCLKLGLLSQNKVYGKLTERISNVSFLHKSIQECFAALYMQSDNRKGEDVNNIVIKSCSSLPSILNMSNVFNFLSGFRPGLYSELSNLIIQRLSEDQNINKYRTSLFFETDIPEYDNMLNFQTLQVDCVEEMLANGHVFSNLPLEDILINEETKHETYTSVLHKLVHGNQGNIKSLSIRQCENTEEVTQILETLDLQYLYSLYKLDLLAVARQPDVEQLLSQSMSTLQYLYLGYSRYEQGQYFSEITVLSKICEEMILSMPFLKSLRLAGLIVTHNQLENITTFLTSRDRMISIFIQHITCSDHEKSCPGVQFNLSGHDNLQLLGLVNVPVSQLQVNTQHLEHCIIGRLPSSVITSCLTSLPAAHNLHTLYCSKIPATEIPTLITTVPALLQLVELYIRQTNLADKRLDLGTDMTRLQHIEMYKVAMTSSALRALSHTVAALSQSVTVTLFDCTVTPEVEYETVKEEIRESDILTVTYDGQVNNCSAFSFRKDNC